MIQGLFFYIATVGFSLGSANVVGYTQSSLLGNSQARAAGVTFENVGDSTLTLSSLTVTGYGDYYIDAGIYAQKLDGYGRSGDNYYWFDIDDPEVGTLYGWYNDEGSIEYNNVELKLGEGLWIYSPNAAFKVQSAGQVKATSTPVELLGGSLAKMVVNPTPVTLDLGDVTISGYGDYYVDAGIYAQKLDGYGRSGDNYYWFDIDDPEVGTLYGWYNDEGSVDYNAVDLEPGEGLWIYSPSASYSVVFPAPAL